MKPRNPCLPGKVSEESDDGGADPTRCASGSLALWLYLSEAVAVSVSSPPRACPIEERETALVGCGSIGEFGTAAAVVVTS